MTKDLDFFRYFKLLNYGYQIRLRIVLLYWQYICQLFKKKYADLYDCRIFTEFENNTSDQIVYLANLLPWEFKHLKREGIIKEGIDLEEDDNDEKEEILNDFEPAIKSSKRMK